MKSPLAVIFGTVALDLLGFGMVVPLLPLYAQEFGASGTQVAMLFASYSLMQFIFAPLWGRLSDKVGRRPVLLCSIAGNTLALVLYGFAHSYIWLLLARVLAGVCTANISVANAYVADVTTPQDRARGMGLIGAAFGLGFSIGPFVGGELGRLGYSVPGFVAAAMSGLNWVSAWFFLPESLPKEARSQVRAGLWQQRLAILRNKQFPRIILCLLFGQVLGFSMLEMSLVLFAKSRLGFDAEHSGRLFAYVGMVLMVVQGGLIGRLVRLLGEVRLVWLGLASTSLALLFIPTTPVHMWPYLLFLMTFIALGQGLTTPSLNSLLSQAAPANMQGAVAGLGQSLSSLARVLGPPLAGLAYDFGSVAWPFWMGGSLMSCVWLLAVMGLRPNKRERIPA